jgi:hypothetical protein
VINSDDKQRFRSIFIGLKSRFEIFDFSKNCDTASLKANDTRGCEDEKWGRTGGDLRNRGGVGARAVFFE